MKKQNSNRRSSPFTFETLEERQFLSVSPAIKADTAFATTAKLSVSAKALVIGQPLTITAKLTSTGGTPRGTIELLNNNKDTGLTATLNHLGYYIFNLGPSQSLYTGSYKLSVRYLSSGNFVGSKSKQVSTVIGAPKLTTESDGLELATVTAGSGAAAATGQTLTVQYTGFDAANGSLFDDSANHSPGTFNFVLNDSPEQVIAGFDQMCTGMKVGETRVAVIPSALGYNDNETRIFIVHLVAKS